MIYQNRLILIVFVNLLCIAPIHGNYALTATRCIKNSVACATAAISLAPLGELIEEIIRLHYQLKTRSSCHHTTARKTAEISMIFSRFINNLNALKKPVIGGIAIYTTTDWLERKIKAH